MAVLVEIVGSRIVRNGKIDPTIVIHINKDGSEAIETIWIGNASFFADVRESTVSIIMEKMIAFTGEASRSAHYFNAAESAGVWRKSCPFSRRKRMARV